MADSIYERMLSSQIWMVWKSIPQTDKKPNKVPYYISGVARNGELDAVEDRSQLGTNEQAVEVLDRASGAYAGLAFALGPDGRGGYFQGLDFDDIVANKLTDIADRWTRGDCRGYGYVEMSPGGQGLHIIGYGREFSTLGKNGSGIEAYAGRRFFTFTGKTIVTDSPCQIYDLADYVEQELAPRRAAGRAGSIPSQSSAGVEVIHVDPETITDLRSALNSMRSDDRDLWVAMGHALKELGEKGRELWLTWSMTSERHRPKEDAKQWDGFEAKRTGYQAVFAAAQEKGGWVNPRSKAAQLTVNATGFGKPRDVLRQVTPPPFEFDEVPPSIADFARAYAGATGHDQSGVIVSAVTAAASVIDDRFKLMVRHQSNWTVSARQWSFLCGGPSAGKSPALRAATERIKAMHLEQFERWKESCEGLDKGAPRPPQPALFTSDSTVAALADALIANERGLLMLTEEMSSWIGAIDSSNKGDAAKNRGDWLQLRDGGARQINRVERGAMLVQNWGVSVLAACTPKGLADHLKSLPEDGLIQRFVPCILAPPNLDAVLGDAREAIKVWGDWLYWAWNHTFSPYPRVLHFNTEARALFDAEELELRKIGLATQDFAPAYAAHLGKHPGMLAEVALIFHVFLGQQGDEVGAEAVRYAIRYMRKVRCHAYVLYNSILSSAPAFELAQSLARSIVASDAPMATVGRDWMTQHCQAFKKAEDRLRRDAVQILEDADWINAHSQARSYGGWPSKYEVNPQVFQLFAREGEQWRARRAAIKDAIGEGD